ncbi:MAG TPA: hypothetical protein VF575_05710 [Candidatus Saccharimonadales bacterium]|jgi:hypothetical protein
MVTIPKKYFHDRLILLLLSINVFMAFLASVWVLFKLDSGRSAGYIVEYRSSLGISALKTGDAGELIAFIGFALLVLVVHFVLSVRIYDIKREVSVIVLALGALLLVMSTIVSNALLVLR